MARSKTAQSGKSSGRTSPNSSMNRINITDRDSGLTSPRASTFNKRLSKKNEKEVKKPVKTAQVAAAASDRLKDRILRTGEAVDRIKLPKNVSLPESLTENKLRAEKLLFREAQYFYSHRKNSL